MSTRTDRTRELPPATATERRLRVRLQTDVEEHEADPEASPRPIPAGRWAWCKVLYWNPDADEGVGDWEEQGVQFRVWDPWAEGGYELTEGTDAKAERVRWGVNRYEFYDAPCA